MSYLGDLRTVVRGADFRKLFATRLVSQASDGAFQASLASLFFFSPERQTTAGQVAGAFAVLLLPYSLVAPFAGVLLDRWRRQQVLVWSNVIRAAMVVGVAGLAVVDATGPALYALVLACLSFNRFFLTGMSAALPRVVPRHELVMANSVATTTGTIVAITGGSVGYGLKQVFGTGDASDARVILISAAAYLCAAWLATRLGRDQLGPDLSTQPPTAREAVRHVVSGLADGARHVWQRPPAFRALAVITTHRLVYGLSVIAAILLFRNYFNDPDDPDAGLFSLGRAFAVSAVGFLVAAVITPEVTRYLRKQTWMVLLLALAAATEAVYVTGYISEWAVLAGSFVVGIAAQGIKICVDTIVQESISDAYRGRVFSFYDVLFNVSFVSAAAFAALTVPQDGYSPAVYAVLACGYGVAAVLYGLASRREPPGAAAGEEPLERAGDAVPR